jgi:transposase
MWLLAFLLLLSAISVYGPKVDQLRESVTNQEQRAFIKCHVLLGTPAVEVHRMLDKIARNRSLSKTHVYRLYNEFKDGSRLSSEEDPRSGRPRRPDTTHEERLRELLNEGECWRTEDLAQTLGISTASTKRLLKEIGAKKVASRWVPYELKPEQKQLRVTFCRAS